MINRLTVLFGLCALTAAAQAPFDLKILDKIGKNAKETANITLDSNTLKMASGLVGDANDEKSKKAKEAMSSLQGVIVRSFEFEKEGQYDKADLKPVREYFDSLGWSKIVDVKEKGEESTIYLNAAGGKMGGMAILAAEPKEVTLVYISGSITMDKIAALSGQMGIPDMSLVNKRKSKPKQDEEN